VGLKPTYGRVSRAGVLPLSWSLDHAGPLTRSVADAAAVLGAIAGHDPADPSSSTRPVPDYLAGLGASVKGLRVGVVRSYFDQAAADIGPLLSGAVEALRGLGCTLEDVVLPRERHVLPATAAIIGCEAAAYHAPLLRQHAAKYATDVRRRLLAPRLIPASDYVKCQRARRLIRDKVNGLFGRFDCLVTPTLAVTAPLVGATEVQLANRRENLRVVVTMFTRLFNMTGHPAVAVPCGFSAAGLPASVQVVGRYFDEATMLRLAHAYEQATEWHQRRPPEQT
jgi:aspartyl-tRNA(Asn)/glutamyl-tRNA(Gln) amidotransferase subunit A